MRAFLLRARAGEADDLVLEDASVLRRLAFLDHLELGAVLHAGGEARVGLRPFGEQPVVVVTPVVVDDGAGGEVDEVGGLSTPNRNIRFSAK